MEKKAKKYRQLHQRLGRLQGKYKRYAAVVAGAAIMAGAALPGIPAAKALAAEKPGAEPDISVSQETRIDKNDRPAVKKELRERDRHENRNRPPGRGWHEHRNSWPSSDENQAWAEDGRIYYRSSNTNHYRARPVSSASSPVDFVRINSEVYGFDAYQDSFKLLTVSANRALVEVTRHDSGRKFNVLLIRSSSTDWQIQEVRAL
ncbi:MAG: hypothetical protein E6X17_10620 [Sporomusaceae bacterium]|nr:hypothetical protein [Sporomusaceae bacterium]